MSEILKYITQLRQAVTHPYLLTTAFEKTLPPENIIALHDQLMVLEDGPSGFLDEIGRVYDRALKGKPAVINIARDADRPDHDDGSFGKGDFGLRFSFTQELEAMQQSRNQEQDLCALCQNESAEGDMEVAQVGCPKLQAHSGLSC
jgi:hypothetical protein